MREGTCSKCGKGVVAGEIKAIALQIAVSLPETRPGERELWLKSLGKYAPLLEGNEVTFSFCYECWLDSLFMEGKSLSLSLGRYQRKQ